MPHPAGGGGGAEAGGACGEVLRAAMRSRAHQGDDQEWLRHRRQGKRLLHAQRQVRFPRRKRRGRFEVEKKLSEGGCGQVYLVRRSRDKRQFALKTEEKKADKSTKRLKVLLPPPRIKKLQKELFTYKGVMRTQKNAAWRTDHLLSCIAIVCEGRESKGTRKTIQNKKEAI